MWRLGKYVTGHTMCLTAHWIICLPTASEMFFTLFFNVMLAEARDLDTTEV